MQTTIDEAGRVAIPLELQTKLGLKPGMKLDVEASASGEAMTLKLIAAEPTQPRPLTESVPTESGLVWKDGVLVFMCEFDDPDFDLPAFVEATRNVRDYDLSGDSK